jgi:hypothetical protein
MSFTPDEHNNQTTKFSIMMIWHIHRVSGMWVPTLNTNFVQQLYADGVISIIVEW